MLPPGHASGDGLADFLVIELTEGAEGETLAARLERGANQVDFAIASLYVAAQPRARALSASSLPLPLMDAGEPVLAGAAAEGWRARPTLPRARGAHSDPTPSRICRPGASPGRPTPRTLADPAGGRFLWKDGRILWAEEPRCERCGAAFDPGFLFDRWRRSGCHRGAKNRRLLVPA